MCPIALILVHALCNGLVFGSTLSEVLQHVAVTPGFRVLWKFPDQPVLSAIARKPSRCDLTKVAVNAQLLKPIKLMGLTSNILKRVYVHALRSGAARDLAYLPKSNEGSGFSTDEIRQTLGHSAATAFHGTTDEYVGGTSREDWNARAKNKSVVHRREPEFSEVSAFEAVTAPVTREELEAWKEKMPRMLSVPARSRRREYRTTFVVNVTRPLSRTRQ